MADLTMSRGEIMAALRTERLAATQRILVLRSEIRVRQDEVEELEQRLEDITHSEGHFT